MADFLVRQNNAAAKDERKGPGLSKGVERKRRGGGRRDDERSEREKRVARIYERGLAIFFSAGRCSESCPVEVCCALLVLFCCHWIVRDRSGCADVQMSNEEILIQLFVFFFLYFFERVRACEGQGGLKEKGTGRQSEGEER